MFPNFLSLQFVQLNSFEFLHFSFEIYYLLIFSVFFYITCGAKLSFASLFNFLFYLLYLPAMVRAAQVFTTRAFQRVTSQDTDINFSVLFRNTI